MCRINYITVPLGPRLALLVGLLGLIVFLPVTVWAGSHVVNVSPPNGVNDTSNLQAALDTCVTYGRDCTVQLAAGKYLTSQLVAYNFRGTFKGKGKDRTIIEALPELEVTGLPEVPPEDYGLCKPNTTDCSWPSLLMFVDGDIHVSDLAVKITAVPATKPWFLLGYLKFTALLDAVKVMGQYRTNASVERIAILGTHDDSDTSLGGFNLGNGVHIAGELPRSKTFLDFYSLSGAFSVSNSSFKSMYSGGGIDGFGKDIHCVVGGSPSAGNVFDDVLEGIGFANMENSVVEVSFNVAAGAYDNIGVYPWFAQVPAKPSLFLIHDNTVKPAGPYADGVFLLDDPTNKWIYALISNNTVEAQNGNGGISAYNTNGTTALNNKIFGNGADGIGIWNGTYAAVLGNDVRNFTASPDLAQIVLDGTTTHSTVVCKTSHDTAMDLGTDNKLIGCQQLDSSVNAYKMNSRPVLKKPPLGR